MSCCAPGTELALEVDDARRAGPSRDEILLASRDVGQGVRQTDLAVPDVHCAACIQSIEGELCKLQGVEAARVNLSTKRVTVKWAGGAPPPLVETLQRIGYESHLFDLEAAGKDEGLAELIRAVAISGFAAGNIMLLSVSVWSGAEDSTRDLFHWLSALIALPALAFAGRIFFRSAWNVLRHGRMNMDVPIAIGVSLAYGMSLYETINHGAHAYFDAAVMLLFFLLIGRTLDHVMRERARVAVKGLSRLVARGATQIAPDGTRNYLPVAEIEPGMALLVAAGERIPVDGVVAEGTSDLDCSLVTGESDPRKVRVGDAVQAGTLNLTGPMTLTATAAAKDSFLAEMVRMMEAAEGGRARYRRIADRASALYAPVVHLTAFLTFLGWMAASGDWHKAITIAIAVLIITCPCALGLAVPIVQVVAARRLFEKGVMVKEGSALERLSEVDTVVFDKTGTLTLGRPFLANRGEIAREALDIAAAIAARSIHPLSRAIADAATAGDSAGFDRIAEVPGYGMEAYRGTVRYRLGRAGWASAADGAATIDAGAGGTALTRDGAVLAEFRFEDRLRDGAASTIAALRALGLDVAMLTGDRADAAEAVARKLGIPHYEAGLLPGGKTERIEAMSQAGRKVLMVGDGLNDAPALAAAHVSIAPATAADVGRNAADFVFLRESLSAVPMALTVSRSAGGLIRQNLALAIIYNVIAVPIAILGFVTPLIAAIAMSMSSVLVIANAMRLNGSGEAARQTVAGVGADRAAGAMR